MADKVFIFFTANELLIYDRGTGIVSHPVPITNLPLRQILAASQSSQPYPGNFLSVKNYILKFNKLFYIDRSCFVLPPPNNVNFTVKNNGRTGAVIDIRSDVQSFITQSTSTINLNINSEPGLNNNIITNNNNANNNCPNISFPPTQYEVQFRKCNAEKVRTFYNILIFLG